MNSISFSCFSDGSNGKMAKPRESLFIKCGENSGALVFEARWSRLPCVSVKYLLDIEPFDCMFFCARPGLTDCYSSN